MSYANLRWLFEAAMLTAALALIFAVTVAHL
jgi:hypothetical protein